MPDQIELRMVSDSNNNKYYRMVDNNNGTWTATWGRIGSTESTKIYPIRDWSKKYQEKVNKGYKDVSVFKKTVVSKGFADISDRQIMELLHTLQKYSKESLIENYTVTSSEVTMTQIEKAQEILNKLSQVVSRTYDNKEADELLLELYHVIPRRMNHTKNFLLNGDTNTRSKLLAIIQREQDSVDNMAQAVNVVSQEAATSDKPMTIEDALGIKISHVTAEETAKIKELMGDSAHQFVRAYAVINTKTQPKFDTFRNTKAFKSWTKLLFHGSRNENFLSILSKGLMIRPTGAVYTGSMFGDGIYTANRAQKSIGYTSLSGSYWARGSSNHAFLALFEINTGMEYRTQVRESWMSSCNEKTIRSRNCDSLYCKGGADLRNDEFIVYNQDQCTIKYLVEIRG